MNIFWFWRIGSKIGKSHSDFSEMYNACKYAYFIIVSSTEVWYTQQLHMLLAINSQLNITLGTNCSVVIMANQQLFCKSKQVTIMLLLKTQNTKISWSLNIFR